MVSCGTCDIISNWLKLGYTYEMYIDDLIKESLLSIKKIDEDNKEERKKLKVLSKATRTWEKLTLDSLNKKLGNC